MRLLHSCHLYAHYTHTKRMGIGKILLIGGAAYLGYKLLQAGGAVAGLSVSVKGLKYGGSDLSKTRIDVDLGIINPSMQTFSFTRFFGQLKFNGELLATVVKDGAGAGITIQPANETMITVPVYINHLSTLMSAKAILEKIIAKQPVAGLQFNGMLYAGGWSVPVNQTVNLIGPSTPGVSGYRINSCFTCSRSVSGVLN